jgi:rhodanese-related sulfurtransferase
VPGDPAAARDAAAKVAAKARLKRVPLAEYAKFLQEAGERERRTIYRFDVRTPQEYRAGHLPGFRLAPGGQLVQETDVFAPVRGARILLADFDDVRAPMTGSWLAQMGWEVHLLEMTGTVPELETGDWRAAMPAVPLVECIAAEDLAPLVEAGEVTVVDLAPSPTYKAGHIPGAFFALRTDLDAVLRDIAHRRIVLTSPDGVLAAFARAEIQAPPGVQLSVLSGGTAAWLEKGFALDTGTPRFLSSPNDVYRRPYEGTDNPATAMQAYLDWEFGLVEQLARDGTHGFWTIGSE